LTGRKSFYRWKTWFTRYFSGGRSNWFLKYSKMMVFWSRDPLVTDGAFSMGEPYATIDDCRLFKEAGIKLVFVGGSMDETSKNFADTWIPCNPYADKALAACG
jgi:hypothetical protein